MQRNIQTYFIEYLDKKVRVRATSAVEAVEKYANRTFFGNNPFYGPQLKTVDAKTRGVEWATFKAHKKEAGNQFTVYSQSA